MASRLGGEVTIKRPPPVRPSFVQIEPAEHKAVVSQGMVIIKEAGRNEVEPFVIGEVCLEPFLQLERPDHFVRVRNPLGIAFVSHIRTSAPPAEART